MPVSRLGPIRPKLIAGMWAIVFLVVPMLLGFISVGMGKDFNWDLKNYHYYVAYAYVTHRLGFDILPAQRQTFYNPLLELPFYYMVRHFPARVTGFLLGVVHGLNFSFVFLMTWSITKHGRRAVRFVIGLAAAVVAVIAPGFLSLLGNTMNDSLISLFVLSSLALLMAAHERMGSAPGSPILVRIAAAGLIIGLAAGLKPTAAVFAVGGAAALFIFNGSWLGRLRLFAMYSTAGVCGALLSAGFWWRQMYVRYGNPFLPYFNNIFRSPYVALDSWADTRFLPRHVWEYFVWPVLFSLDSYRVNQIKFLDIRFALLYVLCILAVLAAGVRRIQAARGKSPGVHSNLFRRRSGNVLFIFMVASFAVWMLSFSQYRYIVALELLVPLCLLLVLDRLIASRKLLLTIAAISAIVTLSVLKPFNWGRLPWDDPYFSVRAPGLHLSQDAVVVMLGWSPTAYVIPAFPPNYRFVRPEGNLNEGDAYGFFQEIKQLVQESKEAIYILYDENDRHVDLAASSSRLGIEIDTQDCAALVLDTPDKLLMCRAKQAP